MIDKLFYIVFNSYYKHGKFQNDHPNWTVGGIFVFAVFTVVFALSMVYGFITKSNLSFIDRKGYSLLEPSPAKVMLLIGLAIIYFSFFYKERYMKNTKKMSI